MNIAMFILCGFCLIFGFSVGNICNLLKRPDGMFIVNDSNIEVTRWILDVNIDPTTIPNRKMIYLKVRKMNEE